MSENLGDMRKANAAEQASFTQSIQETQQTHSEHEAMLTANKMDASQDKLLAEAEDNSAMGIMIKNQKLVKKQATKKTDKVRHAQKSVLVRKDDADGLAGDFSQRRGNREYHLDSSSSQQDCSRRTGGRDNPDSNPDEIITLLRRKLSLKGENPDVSIVDKTFEFLLEVTGIQLKTVNENDKPRLTAIHEKLEAAKNKHFDAHAAEIQVAQKIIGAVDAVVETTGQTVKETLDHYRDVVHNPPDMQTLRKFYEGKGYRAMALELKGLSSYLGGNFKRFNIDNPELAQLASAARKMQGLLGVFRQSKAHFPRWRAI